MQVKGKRLGYIRVSSGTQNLDRQLHGIEVDKMFEDKISGVTNARERPGLDALLEYARDGDWIIVHSMDRLSRSVIDLLGLIESLVKQQITIQFIKENLTISGDESPFTQFIIHVLGAVSQFERSISKERQREGIARAKERGVYKNRKKNLSPDQMANILKHLKMGVTKTTISDTYGISRMTLERRLQEYELNNKEIQEKKALVNSFLD